MGEIDRVDHTERLDAIAIFCADGEVNLLTSLCRINIGHHGTEVGLTDSNIEFLLRRLGRHVDDLVDSHLDRA